MFDIREYSRCTAENRAHAVLVMLALAAGLAQADAIVDHYHLGDAQWAESLQIAVINDIQGDMWKFDTAVSRLKAIDTATPLSVVMVAGDFGGHIDTSDLSRQKYIIAELNKLSCPWIPIMGNHEVNVGEYLPELEEMRIAPLEGPEWEGDSGVQGMFLTRAWHRLMEPEFRELESLYSDPGGEGPIADFRRHKELPNNFMIYGWPDSFGFDGSSRDGFDQCSFRVGPPESPYRFLSLGIRGHGIRGHNKRLLTSAGAGLQ